MSYEIIRWSEEVRVLLTHVEQVYDRKALDRALDLLRRIVAEVPPATTVAAHFRYLQGWAHQVRFEKTGDPEDLAHAVEFGRESVTRTPAGDGQRPMRMATLAVSLLDRYKRFGDRAALEEAVDLYRTACDAGPDHPLHGNWLVNLGWALRERGERVTDRSAVDEAIAATRGALATAALQPRAPSPGRDDLSRARLSNDLAQALWGRFEIQGEAADLAEAIDLLQIALSVTPEGHPDRAQYQSNLALMLRKQAEHTGSATDVDSAIATGRAAVRGNAPPPAALVNLSAALRERYQRLGDLADLDESIELARRGIAATDDEAHRVVAQSNLADALRGRFLRTFDRTDLDEAARLMATAVAATPAGHPREGVYLANLGGVLQLRFERFHDEADLREAIRATRAALAVTPPGHPLHSRYQGNLSLQLQDRFEFGGDRSDLDAAVETAETAVSTTAAEHPEQAARLLNLGMALILRHRICRAPADDQAACRALRQAAGTTTAPATTRLRAARLWAETAASAQRWAEALEAYEAAVNLLAVVAWRGIGRSSREQMLHEMSGLGSDGAACAVAAGKPRRAVELVEQGRAVLWSQLLEVRTDPAALRDAAPELAAQMQKARSALDTIDGVQVDEAMRLAREWDSLLQQARALPGFEWFGAAPEFGALTAALPTAGPVAIINVSRWRCDALLVHRKQIRVVPLTDVTAEDVAGHVEAYLGTLEGFSAPAPDGEGGNRDLEAATPEHHPTSAVMDATLEWLWDTVTGPVLDAYGFTSVAEGEPWPRVWWCPTGLLALLPLHAAGHHRVPGRSTLDRVVSSYVSTLRGLVEATRRPPVSGNGRLLLIGLPSTPSQTHLPAVELEQKFLSDLLPAQHRTELTGPAATHAAILKALPVHPWFHAACHGTQVPDDPGSGGLLPHDWNSAGPVGIKDVTRADHPGGELAFLSACQTATVSATSIDEVITLAAGLHYAGWRHVIGTLWTVGDTAAAELTRLVYPALIVDGTIDPSGAAEALHHAQRHFRAHHPGEPSRWALFTHTGP
jgi:tetratricopeptide (TPR) repeat protein